MSKVVFVIYALVVYYLLLSIANTTTSKDNMKLMAGLLCTTIASHMTHLVYIAPRNIYSVCEKLVVGTFNIVASFLIYLHLINTADPQITRNIFYASVVQLLIVRHILLN